MIYAINKGTAIVVAAGNSGIELTDSRWDSPASYAAGLKGLISVGSLDSKNGKKSSFSNYSKKYVEVLAPGSEDSSRRVGLLSTLIGNKYGRMEGTSMASPVAAGSLAILRAYLPASRTRAKVIEDEFLNLRRLENDKLNQVLGGGVLDLSLVAKAISSFASREVLEEEDDEPDTEVPGSDPGQEPQAGTIPSVPVCGF